MKKFAPALLVVFMLTLSSSAFARGGYYHHTPYHGHHGYDGLAGLAAGLLLGTVITSILLTPQPREVYVSRYQTLQPEIIAHPPRVCVEERRVSGEWQVNPSDGARVWTSFPYPMKRSFQVPCY